MEAQVTQCPHCGTSFRVTDSLLAIAAGAVRCGSCLHIFNARENLADDRSDDKTASIRDTAEKPERREPVIDDDVLFDDDTPLLDDGDDEPADTSRPRIFNPSDSDFLKATAEDDSVFGKFLDEEDWLLSDQPGCNTDSLEAGRPGTDKPVDTDGEPAIDESWAEDLLDNDAPNADPGHVPGATAQEQPPEPAFRPDFLIDHEDILTAATAERADPRSSTEEHFLDLPSALDPGLRRSAAATTNTDAIPATDIESTSNLNSEEPEPEPKLQTESFSAGERIGGRPTLAALSGLNTEPIHPPPQFAHARRWPQMLWGPGFVIAAAALPAQYLYFNFNHLARSEFRPWLAQACALIGCVLPTQSEPTLIRTGSLIVRSHPSVSGALAVDAIITNLATFAQPYPELVLQFTDMNGNPVAGRRFRPEEYLGGELTGSRLMPVGQPVHISLEVRDPGPRAVNYLLAVSPAQP